jgi:predicted PurR-regulated permease PerM
MVWAILLHLADVLVLFFFAWLLAFMLEPLVSHLQERQGLRRPWAVSTVVLGLTLVLVGISLWLVPALVAQLTLFAIQSPAYVDNLQRYVVMLHSQLVAHGIDPYPELWRDYQDFFRTFATSGPTLVTNAIGVARSAAALLVDLVIVVVVAVYLMLDSRRLTRAAFQAVPAHLRDDLVYFIESVRRAFGGFLRGQLVLSVVCGLGPAAVMTLAGLDFVLVASVFAAVVMLIPFLGPPLALAPPAVIALLIHPDRVWWILLLLVALQSAVLNVVQPRVMGHTVGMHPLLVVAAVLVGAKLAGVWGALFGVPIAGVAVAMVAFYRLTVDERRQRAANVPPIAGQTVGPSAAPVRATPPTVSAQR